MNTNNGVKWTKFIVPKKVVCLRPPCHVIVFYFVFYFVMFFTYFYDD